MSLNHSSWRERRAEAHTNLHPSAYQPSTLPLGQISWEYNKGVPLASCAELRSCVNREWPWALIPCPALPGPCSSPFPNNACLCVCVWLWKEQEGSEIMWCVILHIYAERQCITSVYCYLPPPPPPNPYIIRCPELFRICTWKKYFFYDDDFLLNTECWPKQCLCKHTSDFKKGVWLRSHTTRLVQGHWHGFDQSWLWQILISETCMPQFPQHFSKERRSCLVSPVWWGPGKGI